MFKGNVFYGIRKIINRYRKASDNARLPFAVMHGFLERSTPFYEVPPLPIWCTSDIEKELYSHYKYDAKTLGSAFLYHLSNVGIRPFSKATRLGRGVLVLPLHSTNHQRPRQNHECILESVRDLVGNNHLKDVTVQLFGLDLDSLDFYRRAGVNVASSGHYLTQDFFDKFTKTAMRHSIVASNAMTTGLFYCSALGLEVAKLDAPYQIMGTDPWVNDEMFEINERLWAHLLGEDAKDYSAERLGASYVLHPKELNDLFQQEYLHMRREYRSTYLKRRVAIDAHEALCRILPDNVRQRLGVIKDRLRFRL